MSDENQMLNAAVDQLIHELPWSSDTSDETITLVAGNIRGAISTLIENGVIVSADEVSRRLSELLGPAKSIHDTRATTPAEAAHVLLESDDYMPIIARLAAVKTHCSEEGKARPVVIAKAWRAALRAIADGGDDE